MNNNTKFNRSSAYKIISVVAITIIAIAFAFPLYWIITGSFKTSTAINATTPQWWPQEWVMDNYEKLFSRQVAPLWELHIPFTGISLSGPEMPAALPHGTYLFYFRYGRVCAGKETFCRACRSVFLDCMRNGAAKAGNLNPIAA